ncbi:MAG: CRTAC1 family protein, partial [Gemmatimonadetes bacterium]
PPSAALAGAGGGVPAPGAPAAAGAASGARSGAASTPLFEDATAALGVRHAERLFDDFARQPLLPAKLSQLGPGLTWSDVDGDGDPDLVVPSGAGGRLTVAVNAGGRFRATRRGPSTDQDQTTALPDPAGGLLVGVMNYEAPTPDSALRVPGVVALRGGRVRAVAPPSPSATGPLALSDVDLDGDLDLFVGGRTVPGAYPRSAPSRLFLREAGRWVESEAAARALEGAGMVSGAVFTDVDGDGDADLVLALDWGAPRLYLNREGRLEDATAAWGLDGLTGRWNGVTAGDLDGDGRMDLVLTGWGRNTPLEANPPDAEHPLRLYYGDFDASGTMDLIEAWWDSAAGDYTPRARLERLARALPYVRRRTTRTWTAYSTATVGQVLGPPAERAGIVEAAHLDHLLLLNRDGSFDARPLPRAAQLAPAFHASVSDLDGDGREDLFLSQNFFPNERFTFRFDGGRGLVLLGDGSGGLEPLSALRSGVAVYGDQRGAALADYDGDGRLDLAVAQNGAPVRLFHNTGARPGVRVRLQGGTGNPWGVGAVLRVVYDDGSLGPAREVRAGGGYWSVDDPVTVLGLRPGARAVRVRWPGGARSDAPLPGPGGTLVIRRPGA